MPSNNAPPSEPGLYLESLGGKLTGWDQPKQRLQKAFRENEFVLFGQEIVRIAAGPDRPRFIEVLVRLVEEEEHCMAPGAFIPVLEHFGMMPLLDHWVVRHALQWYAAAKHQEREALLLNLSPQTLAEADFPTFVAREADAIGLPAAVLGFEIDDSKARQLDEAEVQVIAALAKIGSGFIIGGFGQGPISFKAREAVPATHVKIDRQIITQIHRDAGSLAHLHAVQQACNSAGVVTIAEFAEEAEAMSRLQAAGVGYAQGFGIAVPRPLTDFG